MLQVIIYDDAGYIAGVQSVLLERDIDMSVNDLTKQAEQLFSKTPFFGEKNDGDYAASIRARCVDGGGGLVHHSLLCRPPRHLQRRKVLLLIIFMVQFVFLIICVIFGSQSPSLTLSTTHL